MSRSELIQAGGAIVLDVFLTEKWFVALRMEGLSRRETAAEQRKDDPDTGPWRSGNPNRYFATTESGPILEEIYSDGDVLSRLERLVGQPVKPTGARGSYSYYDRPGHFLGLHRDICTCDVTLITCLERKEGARNSGALRLYPKSIRAKLSEIGPTTPHYDVAIEAGQSLILLGGCIPHEVLPAVNGFSRAIAVLCFEMTKCDLLR